MGLQRFVVCSTISRHVARCVLDLPRGEHGGLQGSLPRLAGNHASGRLVGLRARGKLTKPNLSEVIDAHPVLFHTLSRMNVCASVLEISPRLQQHKITAAAVAMSKVEMVRASQVSMMILGVNLIFAHGRDVAGPKKKHKPSLTITRRPSMLTCQKDSGGSSN